MRILGKAILAVAFFYLLPVAAQAKLYRVQFWTIDPPQPFEIQDDEAPGGIEVKDKYGDNIACALAGSVKTWNSRLLTGFSVGFDYDGEPEDIKFIPYGAIERYYGRSGVAIRVNESPNRQGLSD